MTFSMVQARADALRVSWSLRYLPVAPVAGWERSAACRGLDPLLLFEDRPGPGRHVSVALEELCGGCPVRLACLRAAACEELGTPYLHGVRGGFSATERSRLKRSFKRCVAVTAA